MTGTNRDLAEMCQILDQEILRLRPLADAAAGPSWIDRRLNLLCRQRIAVCAALVNRRVEASNKVVVLSRWVSGCGALGSFAGQPNRVEAISDMARRGRSRLKT